MDEYTGIARESSRGHQLSSLLGLGWMASYGFFSWAKKHAYLLAFVGRRNVKRIRRVQALV